MSEYVHIVCLDAPSPPDYGGTIDMFYKIKSLHSIGKKVILHYFNYKKNRNADGLEKYCEEINVYNRSGFLKSLITVKPYIVSSRINTALINRLNSDHHPVILEGIHCSGIIPYLQPEKKIVVRIHNNEADYYKTLATSEKKFFKRLYFSYESSLLSTYQKKISKHPAYAFISSADGKFFSETYELRNCNFIPSFIPWQAVSSKSGKGNYCLYHGSLSISENKKAVAWLIENILPKINLPLFVSGRNAESFRDLASNNDRIKLINNPTDVQLNDLIENAHINLIPSINTTGVKLKLLHALFKGRFCISNENGVKGSAVEKHVIKADTIDEWIKTINQISSVEFSEEMIEARKDIFSVYNNTLNAARLNALL